MKKILLFIFILSTLLLMGCDDQIGEATNTFRDSKVDTSSDSCGPCEEASSDGCGPTTSSSRLLKEEDYNDIPLEIKRSLASKGVNVYDSTIPTVKTGTPGAGCSRTTKVSCGSTACNCKTNRHDIGTYDDNCNCVYVDSYTDPCRGSRSKSKCLDCSKSCVATHKCCFKCADCTDACLGTGTKKCTEKTDREKCSNDDCCVEPSSCDDGICCPEGHHNDDGICCPEGHHNSDGNCCPAETEWMVHLCCPENHICCEGSWGVVKPKCVPGNECEGFSGANKPCS
ncbi:MAG: hypothetical protein ACMXYG_03405 [Candidatus Woesearchaeota archaeon]